MRKLTFIVVLALSYPQVYGRHAFVDDVVGVQRSSAPVLSKPYFPPYVVVYYPEGDSGKRVYSDNEVGKQTIKSIQNEVAIDELRSFMANYAHRSRLEDDYIRTWNRQSTPSKFDGPQVIAAKRIFDGMKI